MRRIVLFAGTTEGRTLAELLSKNRISCTVCVATEYGETVLGEMPGVTVRQGRMDEKEMEEFLSEEDTGIVVDCTHPFAALVSENIRNAAAKKDIPYLRLCRKNEERKETQGVRYFPDPASCAAYLSDTEGNILLTTGSKDLGIYCSAPNLRERLFVRVLPAKESIEICEANGITGRHILAMQGPFTEEMNLALIHQYGISHLVTKESGAAGGFPEKISACRKSNIFLSVIGRPEESGLSYDEVLISLEEYTGKKLQAVPRKKLEISLVGTGMGNPLNLTKEAELAIKEADHIFGSKRLLEGITGKKKYAYYRAEDILPVLEEALKKLPEYDNLKAAVLFSGDTGFYSGAASFHEKLEQWKENTAGEVSVRIFPGISSVSYFAACLGTCWEDGEILSIHGKRDEAWQHTVVEAVRYREKVFLILSGAAELHLLGNALLSAELSACTVITGYNLSYEDQEIRTSSPEELLSYDKEGLYICLIRNLSCEKRRLTPGYPDTCFLRDSENGRKIPISKEEVREVALCKLRLTEDSVFYDIGSGSGSIAVEAAKLSGNIQVYAIEEKEKAAGLIERNCGKFYTEQVKVICGHAPEALEDLPSPTHAFIGGSGGELKAVLRKLYQKNPKMRVVLTAVTLETRREITEILNEFPVCEEEVLELHAARSEQAGAYHLMRAENPVMIFSFTFQETEEIL